MAAQICRSGTCPYGYVVAAVATADAGAGLRHAALVAGVTCFTTVDLIKVAVKALELDESALAEVRALEDWAQRG